MAGKLDSFGGKISDGFDDIKDVAKDKLESLGEKVSDGFDDIKDVAEDKLESLGEKVSEGFDVLKGKVVTFADANDDGKVTSKDLQIHAAQVQADLKSGFKKLEAKVSEEIKGLGAKLKVDVNQDGKFDGSDIIGMIAIVAGLTVIVILGNSLYDLLLSVF